MEHPISGHSPTAISFAPSQAQGLFCPGRWLTLAQAQSSGLLPLAQNTRGSTFTRLSQHCAAPVGQDDGEEKLRVQGEESGTMPQSDQRI